MVLRLRSPKRRPGRAPSLLSVFAWIRTLSLEGDAFVLETPDKTEVLSFPLPSMPGAHPEPVLIAADSPRVRFVVRAGMRGRSSALFDARWRRSLRVQELEVLERDAPHGLHRPLRLGLSQAEGWAALRHVRHTVECILAAREAGTALSLPDADTRDVPRLAMRSGVAVALWTRGRLRGSIVCPPGQVLRTFGQVAVWACGDRRFPPLTRSDLADTVLQASVLHAPRVTLSRDEIETSNAYFDKALFASNGTRSGLYLPEIFNLARHRALRSLTESAAKEKAGIATGREGTIFEVCEVTEVIESADRSQALWLDGPVACLTPEQESGSLSRARDSGALASDWLARIQREDGALPLRVRPTAGAAEGLDVPRMAMTAEGLAAFGVAYDEPSAVATARRVLAWVERSDAMRSEEPNGLLVACYVARAKLWLDEAGDRLAAIRARLRQSSAELPVLVASHALSSLAMLGADSSEALANDLSRCFDRELAGSRALSLAEWAELVRAPSSSLAGRVREWLCGRQLESGAFPDTTTSDFVYTRGTGKIFEVLADGPPDAKRAATSALSWLLRMQYREDSMFFVPTEHRAEVRGGLRHDYSDTDAWIDSAGHLLLGLARLKRG